ncbi:CMT1A duplicated region transcript 1 protein [Gracilinanus agilis]|uniref:CMT1A duplicated region transcript 1 protein n=1 Tax=Gracilinanus agilis TaxID=191870 RepID=UPI001CFEA6B5|nr:CMT1A duplicated region transcript 1 protein [Gracilinanus agilis]
MENVEFKLEYAPDLRCQQKNQVVPVCQKCETCVLAWKIFSTKEWFWRISGKSRQQFLVRILKQLKSLDLLYYFQRLLSTSLAKDFTYFRSRAIINQQGDHNGTCSGIKRVDEKKKDMMLDTLRWFANSSHRMKVNYILLLLQMCDCQLLFLAASVVHILFLREQRISGASLEEVSEVSLFPESLKEAFYNYEIPYSRPHAYSFSRVSGSPGLLDVKHQEDYHTGDGRLHPDLLPLPGEMFSKRIDVTTEDKHIPYYASYRQQLPEISKEKDFIRCLPVHISKYILGLLDKKTLNKCLLVSRHWALLAEQVRKDHSTHQYVENEIALLQETYSKGIYPNYAGRPMIPVPKIEEEEKSTSHSKASKWKVKPKAEYSIWAAYQGQETVMVQMEERNVFCGNHTTHILCDTWDNTRVIHYCGGKYVVESAHRKIELKDINQRKLMPVFFRGHTGSIRALILCEKESLVVSGSYDLTIRCWNIDSGLCTKIFIGHNGTITCLDLHEKKLVSGSRDCQVKVWDMNSGKCLKTFKHKDPIWTVKMSSTHIVSGCERGLVKVWHIVSATLVKILKGHEGPVKCLCFDEWHLLTGSNDGFVIGWSMVGKYERCLMAFKHPREVLCVAFLYLRVISGCADGKIRIFNFLTGTCLKVMKANCRGDPVLSFFIEGNRMVINTEGNIVMFQFEEIKWQYHTDKNKAFVKKPKEKEKEDIVSSSKDHRTSHPKTFHETEAKHHGDTFQIQQPTTTDTSEVGHQRLKKQGLQLPLSPDQLLLTVSSLQQAHIENNADHLQIPKINVRDAWGPAVLQQETSSNFLDVKGMSLLPGVAEQAAQIKKLKSASMAPGLRRTSTPYEIQKLKPNLKKSLHNSKVCTHIPQPVIVRPKSCGTFKDGEEKSQAKQFSFVDGQVQKIGNLTSTQIIKPNRMVIRNTGEVSYPRMKPASYTVTANPYRINTGFMLLTVKQKKEYNEAKMMEYQNMKSTGIANPDKASKVAWLRKIKSLSIDDFMKKGKTAAPEFGHNTFI